MAKAATKDAKEARHPARHFIATLFATLVVGCCWAVPIGVAAKVNLDTVGQLGATWAAVGILTVVLGAISIHNALHEQGVAKKLLFAVLALIFLAINFSNALANLSLHSEASRDTKKAAQETVATLRKQVSQVSQAREEQAAIAGNATPEAIELTSRRPRRRTPTGGILPNTATPSGSRPGRRGPSARTSPPSRRRRPRPSNVTNSTPSSRNLRTN